MLTMALISGFVALAAGLAKFAMDLRDSKRNANNVSISVGGNSITLPNDLTPEQVAAVVAVLKKGATVNP